MQFWYARKAEEKSGSICKAAIRKQLSAQDAHTPRAAEKLQMLLQRFHLRHSQVNPGGCKCGTALLPSSCTLYMAMHNVQPSCSIH